MTEDHDPDSTPMPTHALAAFRHGIDPFVFPEQGMPPEAAYELLHTALMLDGRPTLNLASFVTTWMEPQAEALIHESLRKNHIDHEEYPAASLVEEACVHMLGDLFHAPDAEHVHLMRIVVRVDLSRRMIDLLLLDLLQAWDELVEEKPPTRETSRPDVWTNPTKANAHAKRRTRARR